MAHTQDDSVNTEISLLDEVTITKPSGSSVAIVTTLTCWLVWLVLARKPEHNQGIDGEVNQAGRCPVVL